MAITMFSSLCLEAMTHLLVDFFAASHLSASVCSLWREMTQGARFHMHTHIDTHRPLSQVPIVHIESSEPSGNTALLLSV